MTLTPLAVTVTITGEIDLATRDTMRRALTAALGHGPVHLKADLSAVTFIDCSSIGVLLGVACQARQAGGSLTLRAPSGAVRMLTETLGLSDILPAAP